MKLFKRFGALCLLAAIGVGCIGCGDVPPADNEPVVHAISSSLLDGKVANLLAAEGIGIENKSDAQTASVKTQTAKKSFFVKASADEETTTQAKNELVKQTDDGMHDVRFHDGKKGSYREWNKRYEKHHHKGAECPKTDCEDLSDEIEAEEADAPTIISLEARVNKLYNAGDFTFVCVSSEIEGEADVVTYKTRIQNQFDSYAYSGTLPTLINVTDNVEGSLSLTTLTVGSGEDKGIIQVKRAAADEGYHQANYWSDNYNQSYVIDNATGITYSLSQFPYIYSVTGNVFTVWKGGTTKQFDYYTISVENGELQFTKLALPETSSPYSQLVNQNALVDIYGNILFQTRMEIGQMAKAVDLTLQGEMQAAEELRYPENQKIIFAGFSETLFRMNYRSDADFSNTPQFAEYRNSTRYLKGTDGKIYRVGFLGSLNNIPVSVLNENGEWQTVPTTTNVTFAPYTGYIAMLQRGIMSNPTYLTLNEIENGYAYFSNAVWGEPAGYIHGGCTTNALPGEPTGVVKLPVAGGSDTELLELTAKLASQNERFVYRTGNYSIVYKDNTSLVLWNRKTGEKSVIENVTDTIKIVNNNCFTVAGKYIPFSGVDFAWTMNSLPTEPIQQQEIEFEAFYSLLTKKN